MGEIIKIVGGGTPKTSECRYWNGNIPWLSVVDFNNDRKYVYETEKHISVEGLNNSSTKILSKGDIIISARGTVGAMAMLGKDMAFNQSCYGIQPTKLVDRDYLYYLLFSSIQELKHNSHGGVFDTITRDTFDTIEILLPSLKEQKRIASILSSLDDKIDLLHQENKTLEAMAETLFRKWFIEDAKEEWEEKDIYTYAEHYKVSIVPSKHPQMFFRHYSIPAFDNGKEASLEKGECIQSNKYIVPNNGILFSKLNPHKDKRVWLILDETENKAICSTEFQVIKPKRQDYLYFMYGWLTNKENYEEISSGVGGTSSSHQRIDPKSIFTFSCPDVDIDIIYSYNKIVMPLYYKQKLNQNQIVNLKEQRDRLLRKLMSNG